MDGAERDSGDSVKMEQISEVADAAAPSPLLRRENPGVKEMADLTF